MHGDAKRRIICNQCVCSDESESRKNLYSVFGNTFVQLNYGSVVSFKNQTFAFYFTFYNAKFYSHSTCDMNKEIVVGCIKASSSKLNDSLIISANVTYIDALDKKKVGVTDKQAISKLLNFEDFIQFQQTLVKAFYTKKISDDKYIKQYDFTIQHCKKLNNSINLTRYPIVDWAYSKLREYTTGVGRCPIGRVGILNNTEIPFSKFPTFNVQRKLKIILQITGKIPSSSKFVMVFNCTSNITVW